MGGEQIAGVMSMVRRAKAMRDGLPFDEKEDAKNCRRSKNFS